MLYSAVVMDKQVEVNQLDVVFLPRTVPHHKQLEIGTIELAQFEDRRKLLSLSQINKAEHCISIKCYD